MFSVPFVRLCVCLCVSVSILWYHKCKSVHFLVYFLSKIQADPMRMLDVNHTIYFEWLYHYWSA